MKVCPSCGNEINDNAILCVNCGIELNSVQNTSTDLGCIEKNIKLIFIGLLLLAADFAFSIIWGFVTVPLLNLISTLQLSTISSILGFVFFGVSITGLVLGFIGCLNMKKSIINK